MNLDLTKIMTNYSNTLNIRDNVQIPKEILENSLITDLKDIILTGKVTLNEDNEIILIGNIKGIMILKDDLTLEPVEHNFETEIEETLEKSKKTLDITDILWQNILVEIPSKVRSTNEDIYLKGDGWRVISEDEFYKERNKTNNPFSNLDKLLNTKEDR